jgi:hypothetical protein
MMSPRALTTAISNLELNLGIHGRTGSDGDQPVPSRVHDGSSSISTSITQARREIEWPGKLSRCHPFTISGWSAFLSVAYARSAPRHPNAFLI